MNDRKPYLIEIYGITHTVLLSDEDAKKRGLSEPAIATGKAQEHVQDKMLTLESAQPRRGGRPKLPRGEDGKIVRAKAESAGDD